MNIKPQRIEVLGVPVDCVDMTLATDVAAAILQSDKQHCVLAVNSEKILRARDHEDLLNCLHDTELLIPDGIGAVIAARLLLGVDLERVPGVEMMPIICRAAQEQGAGVYLFGAKSEVNQATRQVLMKQFPNLNIVGNHDGYVNDVEMSTLIKEINSSGADVLFVALGSPLQEFWICRHRDALDAKLIQGVGGSFDVISGHVKRAPSFFRKANLEWFYRVIAQPSKFPRGLISIKFGFRVILEKLRKR